MNGIRNILIAAAVGLLNCAALASTNVTANRAVKIQKPGLPNLHRISDRLYRSAQPTKEGFGEMKTLGIKTVVNLRAFHSDRKGLSPHGLKHEHINFNTWHPEDEDVIRFLKLVTDTNAAPVLVHCQHGADRTGTMIAIYRITVEGWSKKDALKEMIGEQFGFHKVWGNLIRFINDLDVDAIKKKVGIMATLS
ncbi:MAG TPA: tyrosine-protein phosphatase [Candidatus Acidoferrum sp.]|nr:tyrosine-protein phosphatase [Candidatus Acidoferrum sp.]